MTATTTGFEQALTALDAWVADGVVAGAAAAIWHRGAVVAVHQAGLAAGETPVGPDTLFPLASVSKPFTAATVLRLVEDGRLDLDDHVIDLLPEFGDVDTFDEDALPQLEALRDQITVRHLLCHTSGLPENISVKRMRMRNLPSLEQQVDLMCRLPLVAAPGTELLYSNPNYGILSRLAAHAAGREFHRLLRSSVLRPFGVADDVVIQPGDELDPRIAHVDDPASAGTPAESYNTPWWRGLGIPWGGLYGTPEGVLSFIAAFLPGHRRVLAAETVTLMTTDQTGGAPGGVASAGVRWPVGRWALGWEVKGEKRRHWTGDLTSPATFCHWGQAGTLAWADPERDLALAVFGNRTVRYGWPLRPPRWAALSDAIVRAADATT